MDLELAAVQAALAVELWDVEFLALLADLVRHLPGHESGRREDEVEFFDLFQFCLQGLECIHREAGGGDLEASTGLQRLPQVIAE